MPSPAPLQVAPFKWKVITPDRLPDGKEWVYYAITPKDYEVLSRNMADILRILREYVWRDRYYRGEGDPGVGSGGKGPVD